MDALLTVAVVPKVTNSAYFESCRQGAESAATELGVRLVWEGTEVADAKAQAALVGRLAADKPAALAVSVEDCAAVSRLLRDIRASGIKVLTWDADCDQPSRDFFVNQATPEGIGDVLATETARALGGKGQVAVLTSTLSAPNQSAWLADVKQRFVDRYPGLTVSWVHETFENEETARQVTRSLLKAHAHLDAILAICAPAVRGAAEAVSAEGRRDVHVIGTASPRACRKLIEEGWLECVVLWNTVDLGYLTVQAAVALAKGGLQQGDTSLKSGRLGTILVRGDEIRLGRPYIFNKANVDTATY